MTGELFAGPWPWLVAGLVLVGAETFAPGIFLVWLGIAALATGIVEAAIGLSWQSALVLFAAFALVAVLAGRALTHRRGEHQPANPHLNRRGAALVGRVFILDGPLVAGEGRIRVDDSVWRVVGPDLPAGARVRALRLDGATLVVEPA
ncbi:MAG: NfeD family protein [Methylobacteriaceae bacterium]|nr:NfeD family protein [Methylobacteriaceae bacterium]